MDMISKVVRPLSRLYSVKSEDSSGRNTPKNKLFLWLICTNPFVFAIVCSCLTGNVPELVFKFLTFGTL